MAQDHVSAWTVFQGAMASLALTFVDRPVHSSLPKFAKLVEDNQKLLLNRLEELHEKTVTDACVMAASAFEAEVSAQLEEAVTALRIWSEKMPSSQQSGFALLHTNWFGEKKANEGQDPFDSLAASRAQELSTIIHILSVCSKKEPLKLDCSVIQAWSRFEQNPPDWCALSEKMIAFRVAARRILLDMGIAHFRNTVLRLSMLLLCSGRPNAPLPLATPPRRSTVCGKWTSLSCKAYQPASGRLFYHSLTIQSSCGPAIIVVVCS